MLLFFTSSLKKLNSSDTIFMQRTDDYKDYLYPDLQSIVGDYIGDYICIHDGDVSNNSSHLDDGKQTDFKDVTHVIVCRSLTITSSTSFSGIIESITGGAIKLIGDMESMFYDATSFNSDISQWDTSKVTNMDRMFSYATLFNSDISQWDTSNVTNMRYMFYNATALEMVHRCALH